MKILIYSPFFIPAFKAGGPIKSILNITSACKDDFDFYVVTRDRDKGDECPFNSVELSKWSCKHQINIFYSKSNDLCVRKYLRHIDDISPPLIYLNSVWDIQFSFKLVLLHRLGFFKKSRLLIAPRGELSKGALSIKPTKKKIVLWVMRVSRLYKNIFFQATSIDEVEEIKKQLNIPQEKIILARNIPSNNHIGLNKEQNNSSVLTLVFISRISEKKNLKFALEVIGRITCEVVFDIYGPIEDEEYWKECKRVINTLPSGIEVNYKGELLPDDVSNIFGKYHGFLFPTLGENYGHVIVESLLSGTPVILSDQTPWHNLEEHGLGYSLPLELDLFVNALNKFNQMRQLEGACVRSERMESARKLVGYDESVQKTIDMFNLVGLD